MKIVKIKSSLIKKYSEDTEMLHKEDRPCVLVVRLKYKNKLHDFAVPIRSNIPAASPKNEFFARHSNLGWFVFFLLWSTEKYLVFKGTLTYNKTYVRSFEK